MSQYMNHNVYNVPYDISTKTQISLHSIHLIKSSLGAYVQKYFLL